MNGTCRACRRPVLWATKSNTKQIPLDPEPGPDGNQAAYRDGNGRWITRQLRKDEEPLGFERRLMPHFATCPRRAHRTAPVVLAPNVIPISRARDRRRGQFPDYADRRSNS